MPYERTYDDLVMSADTYEDAKRAGRWLESGIEGAGLRVNERKKAKNGLQPARRRGRSLSPAEVRFPRH